MRERVRERERSRDPVCFRPASSEKEEFVVLAGARLISKCNREPASARHAASVPSLVM